MNSHLLVINGNDYRLRFSNQSIYELEKRLGKSLTDIMADIGDRAISEPIAQLLQAALRPLQPGVKLEDIFRIMDEYIDDGHDIGELVQELVEALKVSGFFKAPPLSPAATEMQQVIGQPRED